MSDLDAHLANVDALLAANNAPRNLDDHLATIDQVLAGEAPLYPDTITRRIPDPGENGPSPLYRDPPRTYDGAMDVKPKIDMSKFAMPILGQEDMNGDRVTRAKPAPGPQVLGGRGTPAMMNSSPPDPGEGGATPLFTYPDGRTSEDSQTTPRSVTSDNPVTPGTWGTGDLPTRAPPRVGIPFIGTPPGPDPRTPAEQKADDILSGGHGADFLPQWLSKLFGGP